MALILLGLYMICLFVAIAAMVYSDSRPSTVDIVVVFGTILAAAVLWLVPAGVTLLIFAMFIWR